jgi:hypothetical protein
LLQQPSLPMAQLLQLPTVLPHLQLQVLLQLLLARMPRLLPLLLVPRLQLQPRSSHSF